MSEIFDGAFVRLPVGLVDRLVRYAGERMAAELRYTGTPDDLRANPDAAVELLERFLNTRPGTITLPFPSAEPGDLLVKQDRGEVWTFTVNGWRELAPVEHVFLAAGSGPQEASHHPAPDFLVEHGLERSAAAAERDVIREAQDELRDRLADKLRDANEIRERLESPLFRAAEEINVLAGAIRRTIEVAEQPDLGIDDRLTAFVEGLETAERIVRALAL